MQTQIKIQMRKLEYKYKHRIQIFGEQITNKYIRLKIELGDERKCSGAISIPSSTKCLVSKALSPSHLKVVILNTNFYMTMMIIVVGFEAADFFSNEEIHGS